MKCIQLLEIIVLMIVALGACSSERSTPTEILTESTALVTKSVETLPPATEPPTTEAPTEAPEQTVPSLGEAAGPRYECFYSDEFEDYLNYYVYVPENAVVNMPLVVYLHGDGEVNRPHDLPKYGIEPLVKEIYGDDYPFILLEPNTRIKSWIKGDIPELLIGLIDRVSERFSVNTDKIILTGHSRGAIGVWDMISIYGNYFSAAVPVSCSHEAGHINYVKAAEVPVWTFAGNIGDIECGYHKYLAQNVNQITVCGGYGKFTVLKGCDHGQAKRAAYVEETFEWMLAQQRGVIPEE